MPNAAMVAFTGTPILVGEGKKTHEIFGPMIDTYTILESEADGSTVPIYYEGRETVVVVREPAALDTALRAAFPDATAEEIERARADYTTLTRVLEARPLIRAKARDMLEHYVTTVLPSGFKAQVVAVSRAAAVRYFRALRMARDELLADRDLSPLDRERVARLEFAAVISASHNQDPSFDEWSDPVRQKARIADFKKPMWTQDGDPYDPERTSPLAFLCVQNMLLTGFDASVEQVLYLDRTMQGAGLLQAVARVNRTARGKSHGLVVDYFGLGDKLSEALSIYTQRDIAGALTPITDQLPTLEARHSGYKISSPTMAYPTSPMPKAASRYSKTRGQGRGSRSCSRSS